MLSESRFLEDDTILKQKVDTRAVMQALRDNKGERIIRDYRGIRVFSSFEKFELFNSTWIIIVEIDEDEIITEHYRRHKSYYQDRIIRYLAERSRQEKPLIEIEETRLKRVEMNEFAKGTPGTVLQTAGVSVCTAVVISYPGRFAYLVHISPTDDIYLTDRLAA